MNETEFQRLVGGCPLCESFRLVESKVGDATRHPLYQGWMLPQIQWMRCATCGHNFNAHRFTNEGFDKLFEKPAIEAERPEVRPTRDRLVMGRFIERAWPYIDHPVQESDSTWLQWLDVGFGNGALVATADEYGYKATGIDTRPDACLELQQQGYRAICKGLMDFAPLDARTFHIVTMLDVLEHIPDPIAAIRHVRDKLLAPKGAFIVSTPNMECDDWRRLDLSGDNPYWREVEHLHNFSRRSLMVLLRAEGFDILRYHPSERYVAGMEIVTRKR